MSDERSWGDIIRDPAPAYRMECVHPGCPRIVSGNNHRKVKAALRQHVWEEHGGG